MVVAAACQGADEGALEAQDRKGQDILAALAALPEARVVQLGDAGIPRFVTGDLGKVEVASSLKDTDLTAELEAIAPVFRANPAELVLRSARTDAMGDHHFRLSQVKNGRKVIGGELVLHVRGGVVYAANGGAIDDARVSDEPAIDAADAIKAARDNTKAVEVEASKEAELAYHLAGDRLDLVYAVDVTGSLEDGTPLRDTVLVNAIDGSIALRIPHIHSAKNREMHDLNHGTSLPGPLSRTEGQAPVSDAIVNTNYDRLGSVYDCYSTLFGRDSFDAAGAKMISSVHYSTNYVNAFWDGTQMVYGDGNGVDADNLAKSMDVTAHELTHAVTEYESNLTYSGESGGLNEAMSDIFGNVCEWYRDGQVVSANTWMVGEDIWTPATANDALRYMNDPVKDGASLDHYSSYYSGVDVHYSSGIANLAFYLLSQGGTHPRGKSTISVTGIGIAKAAQVFYRANASILTSNASFEDAKTATVQAAQQLGYTAAEIDSVAKAWQAVGVGVPIEATALQNGVSVSGLSGAQGSQVYYKLDVPVGATNLAFTINGGSGDADMYVKFGSAPTSSSYECRPYLNGNAETCTITNIQAGTYYVMLRGYSAYSGVTLNGSFTAPAVQCHLVINEVEYDELSTDTAEYVEIYNPTSAAVDLSTYSLVFVNGSDNSAYLTVDLSSAGSLAGGQYLVVGSTAVTAAAGAKKINFSGSQSNKIQNGSPDGVALVSNGSLIDALSYEGSITAASIPGVGTVSLVEGTALASSVADSNSVTGALCRSPNGADTDNANADWTFCSANTPGSAN